MSTKLIRKIHLHKKETIAMRFMNYMTRRIGKALLNAGALSLFLTSYGSAFAAEDATAKAHRTGCGPNHPTVKRLRFPSVGI